MSTAILFPGQGAQTVGMGKELAGLIKRIDKGTSLHNIQGSISLEDAVSAT